MKWPLSSSDLWIAAGCLVLGFLYVQSHRIDPSVHHLYEHELDHLATLDTRVNEAVLRAGAGLLPHYDTLVESARLREESIAEISIPPRYFDSASRARYADEFADFARVVEQKSRFEERFKTLHAAVRGSFTYFPIVSRGLISDLATWDAKSQEAKFVNDGVSQLFAYMAVGGSRERLRAEKAVAALEALDASRLPEASQAALEATRTHARNLIDRKPELDRLIEEIVTANTASSIADLRSAYQVGHEWARQRKTAFDRALYLCSAVMLILVAVGLRRLIAARRRLDEINARLEDRVAARTAELTGAKERLERDAQSLHDLNERLQRSYRDLDQTRLEQLETRDKFLSHVSHELRTPLTAVHQFVSLVLDGVAGETSEKQREFLEVASRNVDQLNRMIADLMEVTRARTGKLRLERQPVAIEELLADICSTFQSKMDEAGIALGFHSGEGTLQVYADPVRVRQVLNNLLENAVKFTPSGGSIDVLLTSDEDSGMLRISVRDTGYGISAEGLARVFDQLHQEGAAETRSRQGLGLGLAICRELVERQDGRIWVDSELGEGSTFHFTLPEFRLARLVERVVLDRDRVAPECTALRIHAEPKAAGNLVEQVRRDIRHRLRNLIYRESDVVLPRLAWDPEREDFWIIAETGSVGATALRTRLERTLQADAVLRGVQFEVETRVFEIEPPGGDGEGFRKSVAGVADFVSEYAKHGEKP